MSFSVAAVKLLASCILLMLHLFCAETKCPPPDLPEGGNYEPKKAVYEEGSIIIYECKNQSPLFGEDNWIGWSKLVTCMSGGKWSEGTPFCENPAKIRLKNALPEEYSKKVTNDRRLDTCLRVKNGTEEFLEYSLGQKAVVYSTAVCWWNGRSTFEIKVSEFLSKTLDADKGFEMLGCEFIIFYNNHQKTETVTLQVSPDKNSSILLCEILFFVKNDEWCRDPPYKSAPNGQLEVGRSKAVLHCNSGFWEKYGREVYATCKNGTWLYLGLQCIGENDNFCDSVVRKISPAMGEWDNDRNTSEYDVGAERTLKCGQGYYSEGTPLTVTCHANGSWTRTTATCKIDKSQKYYKIIGISGGILVTIIIITLIGAKLFLISRKKSGEMPIMLKHVD